MNKCSSIRLLRPQPGSLQGCHKSAPPSLRPPQPNPTPFTRPRTHQPPDRKCDYYIFPIIFFFLKVFVFFLNFDSGSLSHVTTPPREHDATETQTLLAGCDRDRPQKMMLFFSIQTLIHTVWLLSKLTTKETIKGKYKYIYSIWLLSLLLSDY